MQFGNGACAVCKSGKLCEIGRTLWCRGEHMDRRMLTAHNVQSNGSLLNGEDLETPVPSTQPHRQIESRFRVISLLVHR